MASTTKNWQNNQAPSCDADDLNGFKNETNNLIQGSGQTLNVGDNQQTHKAVATYSVNGGFCIDSGSANAYVLEPLSGRQRVHELQDGMRFYCETANANTGATTVNAHNTGAKAVVTIDGDALSGGEITGHFTIQYDLSNDRFFLIGKIDLSLHGQCILVKDGTNLRLKPYNGNKLIINGVSETVPDAGVAASPSGLVADTTYFIYARMVSGSMQLDFASAGVTSHETQSGTGVEIYTGDPTRTLVGIAHTNDSIAWQDSVQARLVRSWFNRKSVELKAELNSTVTTTSTTWVELNNNERAAFVCWDDEVIYAGTSGRMINSDPAGRAAAVNIGLDGTTTRLSEGSSGFYGAGAISVPAACSGVETLTEGYHYITMLGSAVNGNTATFHADGANVADATGLTGVLI